MRLCFAVLVVAGTVWGLGGCSPKSEACSAADVSGELTGPQSVVDDEIELSVERCERQEGSAAVRCFGYVKAEGEGWQFTCQPAPPTGMDDVGTEYKSGDFRYNGVGAACPQSLTAGTKMEISFLFSGVDPELCSFSKISISSDPVRQDADPEVVQHTFENVPIQ